MDIKNLLIECIKYDMYSEAIELLNEKLSNYETIFQDVMEKAENILLTKRDKLPTFTMSFYYENVLFNKKNPHDLKFTIAFSDKFNRKEAMGSFSHVRQGMNSPDKDYIELKIRIATQDYIYKNMNNKAYEDIIYGYLKTLAHEITHLSQDISGALNYENYVDRNIRYTKNLGVNKLKGLGKNAIRQHHEYPSEIEANLAGLYYFLLKGKYEEALNDFSTGLKYYSQVPYKTYIAKGYSIGLRKELKEFKNYVLSNYKKVLNYFRGGDDLIMFFNSLKNMLNFSDEELKSILHYYLTDYMEEQKNYEWNWNPKFEPYIRDRIKKEFNYEV